MSTQVKDVRMQVVADVSRLSPFNFGSQGPLWWGIWGLIFIETTVFASLVTSFYYLGTSYPELPPPGTKEPELFLPTIASLILFSSSLPMHFADKAGSRGDNRKLAIFLVISILLASSFLVLKVIEYSHVEYRWDSHAYGSAVWAIVIFHSTHVTALLLKTVFVCYLAFRGYFTEERHLGVTINGIYWHFVVAVWLPLYLVLYWSPRFL